MRRYIAIFLVVVMLIVSTSNTEIFHAAAINSSVNEVESNSYIEYRAGLSEFFKGIFSSPVTVQVGWKARRAPFFSRQYYATSTNSDFAMINALVECWNANPKYPCGCAEKGISGGYSRPGIKSTEDLLKEYSKVLSNRLNSDLANKLQNGCPEEEKTEQPPKESLPKKIPPDNNPETPSEENQNSEPSPPTPLSLEGGRISASAQAHAQVCHYWGTQGECDDRVSDVNNDKQSVTWDDSNGDNIISKEDIINESGYKSVNVLANADSEFGGSASVSVKAEARHSNGFGSVTISGKWDIISPPPKNDSNVNFRGTVDGRASFKVPFWIDDRISSRNQGKIHLKYPKDKVKVILSCANGRVPLEESENSITYPIYRGGNCTIRGGMVITEKDTSVTIQWEYPELKL